MWLGNGKAGVCTKSACLQSPWPSHCAFISVPFLLAFFPLHVFIRIFPSGLPQVQVAPGRDQWCRNWNSHRDDCGLWALLAVQRHHYDRGDKPLTCSEGSQAPQMPCAKVDAGGMNPPRKDLKGVLPSLLWTHLLSWSLLPLSRWAFLQDQWPQVQSLWVSARKGEVQEGALK